MGTRRGILLAVLCAALAAAGLSALAARERLSRCAYVPIIGEALLPAPDFGKLAPAASGVLLPIGWSAPAVGVQIGDFAVSGGHSFQLLGIANELRTPAVAVRPGQPYCVSAQALADSRASATRLRATFHWQDAAGRALPTDMTGWQAARQWGGPGDAGGWSLIGGAFTAPAGAAQLAVSFQPASDDRVYLDKIVLRAGGAAQASGQQPVDSDGLPRPLALGPSKSVTVSPWPDGRRAAVSFSFDWETAMGGLVHSRSVGEPLYDVDPTLRAMRMREGVTTTLAIFQPLGVQATYYANGYNFLLGNQGRRMFMGNPTFGWATRQNRWTTDAWSSTPWFAPDPYGSVQSDPAWYFGDLVPVLAAAGQDVQSHTFSHLYAGLASLDELRADLRAWDDVAAERGLPPASSLAFPWSGSAGLSDSAWDALADAGISSVTRTSDQVQYALVGPAEPRCRPVPGHERILACPDFYLTAQSADAAIALIERAAAAGGMIDLWAHTEEVVTPAQIAAWSKVVGYAAARRDAGTVWIAPLAQIAARQQAVANVTLGAKGQALSEQTTTLIVTNHGSTAIDGLTLRLSFPLARATSDTTTVSVPANDTSSVLLSLQAGQTAEVIVWPA